MAIKRHKKAARAFPFHGWNHVAPKIAVESLFDLVGWEMRPPTPINIRIPHGVKNSCVETGISSFKGFTTINSTTCELEYFSGSAHMTELTPPAPFADATFPAPALSLPSYLTRTVFWQLADLFKQHAASDDELAWLNRIQNWIDRNQVSHSAILARVSPTLKGFCEDLNGIAILRGIALVCGATLTSFLYKAGLLDTLSTDQLRKVQKLISKIKTNDAYCHRLSILFASSAYCSRVNAEEFCRMFFEPDTAICRAYLKLFKDPLIRPITESDKQRTIGEFLFSKESYKILFTEQKSQHLRDRQSKTWDDAAARLRAKIESICR